MKFYWCPRTRAVRIGWLLEESGIDYERRTIDIRNPEDKKNPEFLAASPMGKVPAIQDGETRLWDSGAIALHIVDHYPESNLGPRAGDKGRGEFVQWLLFTNSVIEPAMSERMEKYAAKPSSYGWGSFAQMIETFEDGLRDKEWIMGDTFTAADCLLGSSAYWLHAFNMYTESELINAYATRCAQRAAFQRAMSWDQG